MSVPTVYVQPLTAAVGDLNIIPTYPPTDAVMMKSDLNDLPAGPTGPTGGAGSAGATGPTGAGASGPRIQTGTVAYANQAQAVVFPTPYTSSVRVFVQGTANAAGVNGYFYVGTYGSLTQFLMFYSGPALQYGPIEVFWLAIGT